ncbi:MAG: hypothetical protein ACT6T3_22045, partial [Agrobacterium sp.]|uniref:hypothetical protein n=1 Tax=Agrobacterium sp. TaxID=361 RepID=UPI004034C33E
SKAGRRRSMAERLDTVMTGQAQQQLQQQQQQKQQQASSSLASSSSKRGCWPHEATPDVPAQGSKFSSVLRTGGSTCTAMSCRVMPAMWVVVLTLMTLM